MSYRKLDVDSIILEDDNEEEIVTSEVAPNLAEATASVDARVAEISNFLSRGNVSSALLRALDDAPYSQMDEWKPLKEKNAKSVVDVLLAAKPNEIPSLIASLNESQLGLLMKYIFKGMEISTSSSTCSIILTWFDKLVELTGVGAIVRVISDPRTV